MQKAAVAFAALAMLAAFAVADEAPQELTTEDLAQITGSVTLPMAQSPCYPTCAQIAGNGNSNEEINLIRKVERREKALSRKVKRLSRGLHRADSANAKLRSETRSLRAKVSKNSELRKQVSSIRRNIASVRKMRGPTGPRGHTGPRGPRGKTGKTGKTGHTGAAGPAGPQGPAGARGPSGAQGPTGPAGARGATGATGATGRRGPRGSRGARGATGRPGRTGARGPRGATGHRGLKGSTGRTGKRGLRGPRGPRGSRGPRGVGRRGPRGLRGRNGRPGRRGPRGPRGARGIRGRNGQIRHVHHHIHHRPKPKKKVRRRPAAGHGCRPARRRVRKQILVCGHCRAYRLIQQYALNRYLRRYGFRLSRGCNPNSNTQAMFVTRSGSPRRSWSHYVARGGLIITEWSISARTYNAVFGSGARRAPRMQGNCHDRVMPGYKKNSRDPFWRVNRYAKPRRTGCGYDMSKYRGITCLGGWNSRTCSLGYKCRGSGRVWLVEADWQDGELHAANWITAGHLFATMILNGGKV